MRILARLWCEFGRMRRCAPAKSRRRVAWRPTVDSGPAEEGPGDWLCALTVEDVKHSVLQTLSAVNTDGYKAPPWDKEPAAFIVL
jgi:hypothetical protein